MNTTFNPNISLLMSRILSHEKSPARTYRHFTLPPAARPKENKKLEFFYIGKKSAIIDTLITSFESGYAAETPEQARTMLKRLNAAGNVPDVIVAEAAIGHIPLSHFAQFLLTNKFLSAIPFMVEGSDMSTADIKKFQGQTIADDVISIASLSNEKLVQKVKFWKKVKNRISEAEQPVAHELPEAGTAPTDFPKRIFDIVFSSLFMILLSPLFLLIIIALKIESLRDPVFYISRRAGKGYNIFNFYKFRTMVIEAHDQISEYSHLNLYNPLKEDGPVFIKIDNDPRITRLGAFLRKCSLDELPQLFNVFKGDMSLVGNRPLPLYEAATLTTDEWAKRFMAPAGITGLWQIKKKQNANMSAEERISLDINYADKSNFLFDLWIMANTPSAVIQRTNA
jgi:lipopolysaccharide/colanic/teichoic acid biosynthesis glycosyltransferase